MRISDWSSDVALPILDTTARRPASQRRFPPCSPGILHRHFPFEAARPAPERLGGQGGVRQHIGRQTVIGWPMLRSEEHTSELQSLMRISYAVFCLKKKIEYPQPLQSICRQHMIINPH